MPSPTPRLTFAHAVGDIAPVIQAVASHFNPLAAAVQPGGIGKRQPNRPSLSRGQVESIRLARQRPVKCEPQLPDALAIHPERDGAPREREAGPWRNAESGHAIRDWQYGVGLNPLPARRPGAVNFPADPTRRRALPHPA